MTKARDIMTAKPFAVLPSDPLWKAAEIMKHANVGGVPLSHDEFPAFSLSQ